MARMRWRRDEPLVDRQLSDYFDTIDKLRREVYNPRTKQMVPARFVYLVKRLPADEATKVLDALEEYPGIFTEKVDLRTYPGGRLAANLVGFVDAEGKGRAGLEQALNERLEGSRDGGGIQFGSRQPLRLGYVGLRSNVGRRSNGDRRRNLARRRGLLGPAERRRQGNC